MNGEAEDRPYTVALSSDEIVALVRYHSSCAKKVAKRFGDVSLQTRANSFFGSGKKLKALAGEARRLINLHSARAKGLFSVLPGGGK